MDREGGDRPGGNLELSWPSPVQFQEEVIQQAGDPKLSHLKLETRDPSGHWRLLESIGDSEPLLP